MIFKKPLSELLNKELNIENAEKLISIPPNQELGDLAFPCFSFAKELKKAPAQIASDLATKISENLPSFLQEVKAEGPFLNFFINREELAKNILIEAVKEDYGKGDSKRKVMVEYSQPNTHKAFHVGHLRGTSMGEALARILKHAGNEVVEVNYMGDTGMHIAKWLWYYNKHYQGVSPNSARDKWIASIYVGAVKELVENKKELEEGKSVENYQDAVDMYNKLIDERSPEIFDLWQKTRQWSLDEFNVIYDDLQAHFDHFFFESEVEGPAKEIVLKMKEEGIAKESEGAIIMDLEEYKLGVWVLLRKDGTALYSAKDIALADTKFKKYNVEESIYVVGNAQEMHMKQLFKTLELMKFKNADKCFHLGYDEVRFPEGKMSSRSGNNVLYSDLKKQVVDYAKEQISSRRDDWDQNKIEEVAKQVAICAMKFEMIARDNNKNIIFELEKVCNFEGDTGPYVQYTHARCNSILRKANYKEQDTNYDLLTEPIEIELVKKLGDFPSIIESINKSKIPGELARYALELCKIFNRFYHECKVIGTKEESLRLKIVDATRNVLEKSLNLLGIDAPKEM